MGACEKIVAADLCVGCGACAVTARDGEIRMAMSAEGYLRPVVIRPTSAADDRDIMQVCAGAGITGQPDETATVDLVWGPWIAARTAAATDPTLRFKASSGGGISAILSSLLNSGAIDGIVQSGADRADPLATSAQVHADPKTVLACAGSRYGPSAPVEVVGPLLNGAGRYAFVGKPCDVAALRQLARIDPRIGTHFVVMISFFCAGVPSRRGSVAALEAMGVNEKDVVSLRYRGEGWPGTFTAVTSSGESRSLDYATSWGRHLNRFLQFRCKICPDGTGELADIVCADAWHADDQGYPLFAEQEGRSLLLSRTKRGEDVVRAALAAGAISADQLDIREIDAMQPYQLRRKQTLAARLLAMMLLGRRTPRFRKLRLGANAVRAGVMANFRATAGTTARLVGLHRRRARQT